MPIEEASLVGNLGVHVCNYALVGGSQLYYLGIWHNVLNMSWFQKSDIGFDPLHLQLLLKIEFH